MDEVVAGPIRPECGDLRCRVVDSGGGTIRPLEQRPQVAEGVAVGVGGLRAIQEHDLAQLDALVIGLAADRREVGALRDRLKLNQIAVGVSAIIYSQAQHIYACQVRADLGLGLIGLLDDGGAAAGGALDGPGKVEGISVGVRGVASIQDCSPADLGHRVGSGIGDGGLVSSGRAHADGRGIFGTQQRIIADLQADHIDTASIGHQAGYYFLSIADGGIGQGAAYGRAEHGPAVGDLVAVRVKGVAPVEGNRHAGQSDGLGAPCRSHGCGVPWILAYLHIDRAGLGAQRAVRDD